MIDYLKRAFDRLPITQEKKRVFNLPNAITMLRIGIIPVLFFCCCLPIQQEALSLPASLSLPP